MEDDDASQPTSRREDDAPGGPAAVMNDDDDDDRSVARARAEVSVMQSANDGPRRRAPGAEAADAAIQGTSGEGGEAFEVVDEGGELVRVRFHEFLANYSVVYTETDGDGQTIRSETHHPYHIAAEEIARKQRRARDSKYGGGPDERDEDPADVTPFVSTIAVNFEHLSEFDQDLADAVEGEAVRFEPYLRRAAREFVLARHPELDSDGNGGPSSDDRSGVTTYFVAIHNMREVLPVRSLRTGTIGRLSSISGTVTRTSDVRPELLVGSFRCGKCGLVAPDVEQQYHLTRPTLCRNPRCQNRNPQDFTLEADGSEYVDWQRLRVQENADEIPPGSMPRTVDAVVRNEMVERAKAGDRVVLTGSLVVVPDGSALARAGEAARAGGGNPGARAGREAASGGGGGVRGLAALGVRELTYRTCFVAGCVLPSDVANRVRVRGSALAENEGYVHESWLFGIGNDSDESPKTAQEVAMEFTEEEKAEIRRMKDMPNLYEELAKSIAPTTFGHTEVKKGILLMLLGGVHKTTSEGIRLRGDINLCIVGDPSTAKSQFLKFVHGFLPEKCVYTSGKAASAAGLTAAVIRDQDTGEFCIEAGALMLADNGVCCIDEFDKMDQHDQVAIHEAMEQQTISLTKAGITATLNARASILAAANPIHGRYDRSKTLRANVQLSAPILSRFDLFFVVLDECDDVADYNVAKHILDVHRCDETRVKPPFEQDEMLRYIRFARTLSPRIPEESRRVIVDCYRKLRQGDTMGRSRTAYRITVRQLESLIRLSEALARLHCADIVKPQWVREAFRLLRQSIVHVETEDITFHEEFDGEEGGEMGGDDGDEGVAGSDEAGMMDTDDSGIPPLPDPYAPQDNLGDADGPPSVEEQQPKRKKKSKKKKKKTQITFEQYESISNALATYLRSRESDAARAEDEGEGDGSAAYLTWGKLVEWHLEQCEDSIGDSLDELSRMRKLTNLVIRRLVDKDNVLVVIGDADVPEEDRKLAVHPNYDIGERL